MANSSVLTADDINKEFSKAVTPVSVIVGILAVVGFLGNSFVLTVHVFKYKSSNFRFFILGLCAVDLLSSVTIIPLEIYTQLNWYVFPNSWLCKMKSFLHVFLSVSAVYVLLLIAIDRYRKICAPYGWQMTPRTLLIGYGVSFIVVCLQSSSVIVVWGLQEQTKVYRSENVTVFICNKDKEYEDTLWPKLFPVIMLPSFAAMVVMLILYSLVGRQIFRVVMKMRQHSKRKMQLQTICGALVGENVEEPPNKMATSSSESESGLGERMRDDAESSESALGRRMRDEIESILHGDTNVETIAYKVDDGGIVCRSYSLKDRKARRDGDTATSRMSFKDKRKMEERSSRILCQTNSVNLDKTPNQVTMKKSKASDTNSGSDGTRSSKSVDENIIADVNTDRKPKLCAKETLRSKLKSLKGMQSLSKRVTFSVKPRDKLKRKTLITFVFTAIFIATTIMYLIISGKVAAEQEEHSYAHGHLVVFLFFYRLYFINSALHPIIYGLLDPKFRKTVKDVTCSFKSS